MTTSVLWACVGLMNFAGIIGGLPADVPVSEQIQVASELLADKAVSVDAVEIPESAVSSPPMAMDDPGTPGHMGIEVNFVGTAERVGSGRGMESLLDANYGIGDRIQLKYERPYVTSHWLREPKQRGLGATVVGVKWRFMDSHGWQMAFYPAVSMNDAFREKDALGNPVEREGHLAYFPLLISKTVAREYTLAANFGYSHNTDHLTKDSIIAFGVGRALGAKGRILGEVHSERDESLKNRQTDVRVGIVGLIFPERFGRSGYEFPAYASFGHSVGATEAGETALTFTLGVSVIKEPKGD